MKSYPVLVFCQTSSTVYFLQRQSIYSVRHWSPELAGNEWVASSERVTPLPWLVLTRALELLSSHTGMGGAARFFFKRLDSNFPHFLLFWCARKGSSSFQALGPGGFHIIPLHTILLCQATLIFYCSLLLQVNRC